MKQEIQIADKDTLDKIKEMLENSSYGLDRLRIRGDSIFNEISIARQMLNNSDYGLYALKTLIDNGTGGGGGWYKPTLSLAISGTQALTFSGKGKLRIFTNAYNGGAIAINSLDVDGLPNHMANLAAYFNNSIEIEFDSCCNITLGCGNWFAFVYKYDYVTS